MSILKKGERHHELRSWGDKKTASSLELLEEMQPCQHLDFSPVIFDSNSDLKISEIVNLCFGNFLAQHQAIYSSSLSTVCFSQGNLLCILYTQVTLSPPLSPASSTQPCLPLHLSKFCSHRYLPKAATVEAHLPSHLCAHSHVVPPVPGLGQWNNSEEATLTNFWRPSAGCMFSCPRVCMHSGLLSTGLNGRVFTLDWVPESTFLSTDLALLTPLNFPTLWLSRNSVHYELTGAGVPFIG